MPTDTATATATEDKLAALKALLALARIDLIEAAGYIERHEGEPAYGVLQTISLIETALKEWQYCTSQTQWGTLAVEGGES
jgi:hypothetical protein